MDGKHFGKAIDLALDIDSPDIDSVNRLTLISEIRIIKSISKQ